MIDLKNGSHWWTTAVDPGSWNGVNRLQSLDLSRNLLSHFDPSVCAFLPHLEELGLSFNRIAWVWREVPAACQNLRRLDLSHNALHAEILQNPRPDTFEAYHQLHVLDLSFNSNRSVPFLGHSINLKIVKLNENGPNPTGASSDSSESEPDSDDPDSSELELATLEPERPDDELGSQGLSWMSLGASSSSISAMRVLAIASNLRFCSSLSAWSRSISL